MGSEPVYAFYDPVDGRSGWTIWLGGLETVDVRVPETITVDGVIYRHTETGTGYVE
jgi:hypothetical protein